MTNAKLIAEAKTRASVCGLQNNGHVCDGCKFALSLADALAAQDWQPIATAPRDGTEILAWVIEPEPEISVVYWAGDNYEWTDARNETEVSPTLWRPLPPTPETGNE